MLRKEFIALIKIRDHAQKACQYCREIDSPDLFEQDEMTAEAATFNIMQIGEISHDMLTEITKSQLADLPWTAVYGLRNRIVHGYSDVDSSILFTTIKKDLPLLIREIDRLIGPAGETDLAQPEASNAEGPDSEEIRRMLSYD